MIKKLEKLADENNDLKMSVLSLQVRNKELEYKSLESETQAQLTESISVASEFQIKVLETKQNKQCNCGQNN